LNTNNLNNGNAVLINGPITHEIISSRIDFLSQNKELGGHSIFLGQVRADVKGIRKVKAIEYSAYEEMVGKEADIIKKAILSEFSDVKSVDIVHSTGRVMAGEVSLLVLVSAGHRQQSMTACSKTVELIKEKLPVWKKEIFEDNTREWAQNNNA
jgi:molybdopterin synthase catalytic subunit